MTLCRREILYFYKFAFSAAAAFDSASAVASAAGRHRIRHRHRLHTPRLWLIRGRHDVGRECDAVVHRHGRHITDGPAAIDLLAKSQRGNSGETGETGGNKAVFASLFSRFLHGGAHTRR